MIEQDIRYAIDQPKDDAAPRRVAKHGPWSATFYNRMRHALNLAPDVVGHVVAMRTSRSAAGERVQTSKTPPAPVNVDAIDDADYLYKSLVYWTTHFAAVMRIEPPSPSLRSRRVDGAVDGFPSTITARGAHAAISTLSSWAATWLESITYLDPHDVQSFYTDIGDVFRLQARWPVEESPRYSRLPCPSTDHDEQNVGRIAIYPPAFAGDDHIIKCENCGRYFDLDDYERLLIQFAEAADAAAAARKRQRMKTAAAEKKSQRVADHLLRQYGAA